MVTAAKNCSRNFPSPSRFLEGSTPLSPYCARSSVELSFEQNDPVVAHTPTMPRAFVLRCGSLQKKCRNDGFVSNAGCRRTAAVGTCHARSMTCCRRSLASSFPLLRPLSAQTMNGVRTRRRCRRRLHRNGTDSIVLISSRSRVTPRPASPALARRLIARSVRVETRSRTCSGTTATRPRFGIFARVHSSASEMRTSWRLSAAFCGCGSNGKGAGWSAKPNKVERDRCRRRSKDRRRLHVNSPTPTHIRVDRAEHRSTRDMPHDLSSSSTEQSLLLQKLVSSRSKSIIALQV